MIFYTGGFRGINLVYPNMKYSLNVWWNIGKIKKANGVNKTVKTVWFVHELFKKLLLVVT